MAINSKQSYNQSMLRTIPGGQSVTVTAADLITNPGFTTDENVFKYDPFYAPLKSTQQLSTDWSRFENHTFFSSAEVKVNEAFNILINSYPFDGTKEEYDAFFGKLTGFEKYVFDNFPKWRGALHFSGTAVGETGSGGTWISVKDKSGDLFPEISKNSQGSTVINPPEATSFSIETMLYLPEIQNSSQVILQKSSSAADGFTLHLEPTSSLSHVTAVFSMTSGSYRNNVSGSLKKGSYNHICVVVNKDDYKEDKLEFYVNQNLSGESSKYIKLGKLDIDDSDLMIGSGSSFYSLGHLVTPNQTLSGVMDELRLFHSVRSKKQQKLYSNKGIFATNDLKLYYRFNEPPLLTLKESDSANSILLDSSGNSLHASINNFTSSLRIDTTLDGKSPMTSERDEFAVVLFPAYYWVRKVNEDLLMLAVDYDRSNPNLITKLIPRHYLLEGAFDEGYETVLGSSGQAGEKYSGNGIPGQGKRSSVQIILSFLYIWAKFFDEIKQHMDAFATLRTVDYDPHLNDTIPDNFLLDLVKQTGFYIPQFFTNSTPEQYAEGVNVVGNESISTTLRKINSHLTRRILMNLPDIVKSKGTQHSIKAFLRSIGLDPDNTIKVREYGGPTTRQLTSSRVRKAEFNAMVDFVSSSFLSSSYFAAPRIEPGYPAPEGNFVFDSAGKIVGTDQPDDTMLTSGSWTIEGTFKIPPQKITPNDEIRYTQSLFRLCTTGSNLFEQTGLIANVLAKSKTYSDKAEVVAYLKPGYEIASPLLKMQLTLPSEGIFDGDPWYVSIGCFRSDDPSLVNNNSLSSSYFLRVGKSEWGEITSLYQTSSYFLEGDGITTGPNVLQSLSNGHNKFGAFLAIGGGQTVPEDPTYFFLNNSIEAPEEARSTDFIGWASNLRFWSKGLIDEEFKEHIRNYKSTGVVDPLKNYNYVSNVSGSFQKLRMNVILRQAEKSADVSGSYFLDDDSQNGNTANVIGYNSGSKVMIGELFSYGHLSPNFDEMSQEDKVRIRSFNNMASDAALENPWAVQAPSYLHQNLLDNEEPQDDTRLSIEFSLADQLNKDIVNMFSSFDLLNNALGDPNLAFSPDYPVLEDLRDIYFNRLYDKVDFRSFFEFYRWFDNTISTFIDQLIPAKTRYKGTNFVVESHMLERHKKQYYHNEMYMGEKQIVNDSLLIQLLSMVIKKY